MCAYSMVTDWGQQRWPMNPAPPQYPPPPTITITAPNMPTAEEWAEFRKLLERAKEYDKRTNQPDCPDPVKLAWIEKVEKRLAELEKNK